MKMGPVLIAAGGLIVGGLYLAGRLPGFGAAPTGTLPDPTGQAQDAGQGVLDQLAAHGIGWPMLVVPAVVATLAIVTWRRIGGWGRAVVLVLGAIIATVLVTR